MKKSLVITVVLLCFSLPLSLSLWRASAADCTRTSMGLIPINDLGTGTYNGAQGGLYPGGNNLRPAVHNSAGIEQAMAIRPLNGSGQPDVNGRYVLLSIGMSNTTQEFSTFKTLADADPDKNRQLLIVDGAQGGQDATAWANPDSLTWTNVNTRLMQAGVTPLQVQIVWLKQQLAGDNLGSFPTGAQTLRDRLRDIVLIAKSRYPNLRLLYLSSRAYGGYSNTLRGTGAYENAFGVKFLVEDQINGDPRLSYAGTNPPAPWLAWGPYLWADGMVPRSDSLTWACSDFNDDGIHPSPSGGRPKVAQRLLAFFKYDSTARIWFLGDAAAVVSISGRVMAPDGRGLKNALVSVTDPEGIQRTVWTSSFGFYTFTDLPAGQTYTLRVNSKRYRFSSRTETLNGDLTSIDFLGVE
ncbi:MAG: carboxypeptidase-like regulatory domain-containing protein [Pyrinomonadaceae bacterium]